jgi:hypothetical protein
MAYGNWGATVYRNGERQPTREDNTPYHEDELTPGYHQAFGANLKAGGTVEQMPETIRFHCHHAVLGSGPFRLCGYKSWPVIFMDGKDVPIARFAKTPSDEWQWYGSDGIEGEIGGYKISAEPGEDTEGVFLNLTEPDGTKWASHCGYGIGAGVDD